ncbi:hypothetical protein LTR56_009150 [Elasticomyces elasticus]|nr:hypothetical protein LTR56_009150 [Elasticomyces elasticus]KAK4915585.1 hypothetical protein LTR49_016308 [Elasticomyces elasticus]KAK5755049.1 hypothetical protein LTS12_014849 [Elasticomyces elasticus]
MRRFKAVFRGSKPTPEQLAIGVSYAPPPQSNKAAPQRLQKPEKEPELTDDQRNMQLYSSTEYVRLVRSKIREKYSLDIWIWSQRHTLKANHELVMEQCRLSDEMFFEIRTIVGWWKSDMFTPSEWAVARQITAGVEQRAQETSWQQCPPWEMV